MNNEFNWTDDLVKEFTDLWLNNFNTNDWTYQIGLERFKESKQPNKDYEILSFYCTKIENLIYYKKDNKKFCNGTMLEHIFSYSEIELLNNSNFKIHSVKRLKDGEVFTIGENVIYDEQYSKPIIEFDIYNHPQEGTICRAITNSYSVGNEKQYNNINSLKKEPVPIFETEDGVSVYAGDEFYVVTLKYFNITKTIAPNFTKKPQNYKRFSTLEKATRYVLLHKPCLSAYQASNVCNNQVQTADYLHLLMRESAKILEIKNP